MRSACTVFTGGFLVTEGKGVGRVVSSFSSFKYLLLGL